MSTSSHHGQNQGFQVFGVFAFVMTAFVALALPAQAEAAGRVDLYWKWNAIGNESVYVRNVAASNSRSYSYSNSRSYSNTNYRNNSNRYRGSVSNDCDPRWEYCDDDYRYNDDYDYNYSNRNSRYNDDYNYNNNRQVKNGGTLTKSVSVGDTFSLWLPGNPSSRYRWDVDFDSYGLQLRSHTTSGNYEVFTFRARTRGTFDADFEYSGSNGDALQEISYRVYVR